MQKNTMSVGIASEALLRSGFEIELKTCSNAYNEPELKIAYHQQIGARMLIGAIATSANKDGIFMADADQVTSLIATAEDHKGLEPNILKRALHQLQEECHNASRAAGWWHCPETGYPYIPGDTWKDNQNEIKTWGDIDPKVRKLIELNWPFVYATKLLLVHAEVSEGTEAHRKDMKDDKLTHRLGLECELADAVIREFDLAGAQQRYMDLNNIPGSFDLGGAIEEKRAFNLVRPDHKVAARRKSGGKKY